MVKAKRVGNLLCAAAMTVLSFASQAGPHLGVYNWEPPGGPSNVDTFSQWLGRSVDFATAFTGSADWSYIEGPAWQLSAWSQWVRAKSGRNLSYAIAMFPKGGSLASCAAGQYDAHYRILANNLAYYGLHWAYLRLGWEMDGNWYPWGAPAGSGKEASFAGCFRRVVQVMRQAQPANQWKFVFNPTDIAWPNATYLEALWPGDAYVHVVGVDSYDQSWWPNTYPYPSTCDAACRLQRQQTAWSHRVSRLNTLRDFAAKHGKPMGFGEWGLVNWLSGSGNEGHGGLDNPYYIQKMYEFITNPANNVVMHSYFNVKTAQQDHRLSAYPNAAARFKQFATGASTGTPTVQGSTSGPSGVTFSAPAAGATISGSFSNSTGCQVTGTGIARVVFFMDSTQLNIEYSSPWQCVLDTRNFANGSHTLRAVAYNSAGASTTVTRTVNVQNGSVSGAPSGVAFSAPAAGATISGSFYQSSGCQVGGTGIAKVVFFMNNTQLNVEGLAPWQCNLDTRKFANGTHTLRAVAYSAAGASTSVTRTVNVKN